MKRHFPCDRYGVKLLFLLICLLAAMTACDSSDDDADADGDGIIDGDGPADGDDIADGDPATDGDAADGDLTSDGDAEQEKPLDPREIAEPFVTDEQGRVLIFHGANVSYGAKSAPYLAAIPREEVMRFSADWGLNFVRYLILWAGVEPEAGVYDTEYFDRIEERLDWFYEAGVWVLLDMHQDVWSEFTCGDGAPEWAVRHDGLAIECPSQWFLGYFQPGVQRCFDNFWNYEGEHSDLQDRYAAMWQAVVLRFKDHPAVIGYDIINEPHPGSDFDAAEAVGIDSPDSPSPEFDKNKLQPFYQRMINAIREVDQEHWIAFEPRYGAPGNGSPSFFTGLDDPREGHPRLMYAPHLYSVGLENNQNYNPEIDHTVDKWEEHRGNEGQTLGTSLMLGEWGLHPEWTNARLFMREVLEMSDRLMAGWAYWAFDPGGWSWVDSDRSERVTVNDIVRVYPQAIAGLPKSFHFDADSFEFRLEFVDREGVSGPTEIYIPEQRFYPNGWELSVGDADGSWTSEWDAEREVLSITTSPSQQVHVIEIGPKE